MNKNYGLNLQREAQEISEQDWQFGAASLPCLAIIPEPQREYYLPIGELQNIGEEKMDCASRGPINLLETKFNYLIRNKKLSPANEQWLRNNGYIDEFNRIVFSDRFVAINSGTTREGNSMKAPLEAIRKQGLIPKPLLPQVDGFDEYHNPQSITPAMKNLGIEFTKRFIINYEQVYESDFPKVLQGDLLNMAGYAWPEPVNGEYPHSNSTPNHVFLGLKLPSTYIFDNYLDTDSDFIKKLAPDYDFLGYGYRLFVSKEGVPEVKITTLAKILEIMVNILSLQWLIVQKKKEAEVKTVEIPKEPVVEPPKVSRIEEWAEKITEFEGWK